MRLTDKTVTRTSEVERFRTLFASALKTSASPNKSNGKRKTSTVERPSLENVEQ